MGWKNVEEYYGIKHIVQVRDGRICIGSSCVGDLIRVEFDGSVSWGNLGELKNDNLARYYAEMTADINKLRDLINSPDVFGSTITVFTHEGSEIIEKQCEQTGYPNCTNDGEIMYENTFSTDKMKVVEWAKEDAKCGIDAWKRQVEEAEFQLDKCKTRLGNHKLNLSKLENVFGR